MQLLASTERKKDRVFDGVRLLVRPFVGHSRGYLLFSMVRASRRQPRLRGESGLVFESAKYGSLHCCACVPSSLDSSNSPRFTDSSASDQALMLLRDRACSTCHDPVSCASTSTPFISHWLPSTSYSWSLFARIVRVRLDLLKQLRRQVVTSTFAGSIQFHI